MTGKKTFVIHRADGVTYSNVTQERFDKEFKERGFEILGETPLNQWDNPVEYAAQFEKAEKDLVAAIKSEAKETEQTAPATLVTAEDSPMETADVDGDGRRSKK